MAARMRPMPRTKLPDAERRALVLDALKPGANRAALAREYDVTRSYLYVLINEATEDPKGRLERAKQEAEDELAFRREVLRLTEDEAIRKLARDEGVQAHGKREDGE